MYIQKYIYSYVVRKLERLICLCGLVLPFGSLAMPSYDKISRDSAYVDIGEHC